jgi:tetratricopeptide (TPR) repeat protein
MSTTVTCPSCQVALRSNKPLNANKTVRCPSCGEQFQTPPDTYTAAPELPPLEPELPATPPPLPYAFNSPAPPRSDLPLMIFIGGLSVVLLASIALVVWLNLQDKPKPAAPVVAKDQNDPEKQKRLDDEKKRLTEREKQLDEEKNKLSQEKRALRFGKLLTEAQTALGRKQYSEAEKLFQEALNLFPDDKEALSGLADVRAGAQQAERDSTAKKEREEETSREYTRLMSLGKEKKTTRDFPAAATAFRGALALKSDDAEAKTELAAVEKVLEADLAQQDALKKYKGHIQTGQLAFAGARYDEAVREFQAALQIAPGDFAATEFKRQAEQQRDKALAADRTRQSVQQELQMGQTALNEKRYKDAIAAADRALKIAKDNADAVALKQNAIRQMMGGAFGDFQANRNLQAQAAYQQLSMLFPNNPAAAFAFDQTVANQWLYIRSMSLADLAMQEKRFMDAARYYAAALQAIPNDLVAQLAFRKAQEAGKQPIGNPDQLLAAANQEMQNRRWKEAIKLLESAQLLAPNNPLLNANLVTAHYELAIQTGQAAMNTRRYQDAVAAFQDALRWKPGDFQSQNLLQNAQALARTQPMQPMQPIQQPPGVPRVQPNPQQPPAPQVNPRRG